MILLLNHTLISKMDWCKNAPDSQSRFVEGKTWRQAAYDDLDAYLLRRPFESNEAAERGQRFEKAVEREAKKNPEEVKGTDKFKKVVEECRGGRFQQFKTKDIEVDDIVFRTYGILDVEKPDEIIDIKTTGVYKKEKYDSGTQDQLYCWLTGIPNFKYVVAEWKDFPHIRDIHVNPIQFNNTDALLEGIINKANELIEFLKETNRFKLYHDCYSHMGKGWKSTISRDQKVLMKFYKQFWDKYEADHPEDSF